VNVQSGAVTPLLGSLAGIDPGLVQVRNHVIDRRRLHEETEMVDPDEALLAGRTVFRMGKDIELLAPHLDHSAAPAVRVRA
jgi:hypothetical protein